MGWLGMKLKGADKIRKSCHINLLRQSMMSMKSSPQRQRGTKNSHRAVVREHDFAKDRFSTCNVTCVLLPVNFFAVQQAAMPASSSRIGRFCRRTLLGAIRFALSQRDDCFDKHRQCKNQQQRRNSQQKVRYLPRCNRCVR